MADPHGSSLWWRSRMESFSEFIRFGPKPRRNRIAGVGTLGTSTSGSGSSSFSTFDGHGGGGAGALEFVMKPQPQTSSGSGSGDGGGDGDVLGTAIQSEQLLQRKFLVIINPKSGKGKTLSTFKAVVGPYFEAAGINPLVFITGFAGHAKSMLSGSKELEGLHGIAVFGGDGLINEVINGLRLRKDASRLHAIPLGIIAGGSGNGLARSIASYAGESNEYLRDPVMQATKAIAVGRITAVNLAEVQLDNRTFYSSLSAGWGFVADVDIESEWLRKLGEARFFIWSLICLLRYRSYSARLDFVAAAHERAGALKTVDTRFVSIYSSIQSHIGTKLLFAPSAKANDGVINLTYIQPSIGRVRMTRFCRDMDTGRHLRVLGVQSVPVKEFTITPHDPGGFGAGNLTIDGERVTGQRVRVKICKDPLIVISNPT